MKKLYMKKHKKTSGIINTAVKIFLFPLFFFALLLKVYDRFFKKEEQETKAVDIWY